jgi:hypothetical protein
MVEDIFAMVSLHSPPANAKMLLDRWSTDGECEIDYSDGPFLDRGPPYAILEVSREPRRVMVRRNQRRTQWLDEASPQADLWYAEILGYLSLGFLIPEREQLPSAELELQGNTVRYFSEQVLQRLDIDPH